MRTCGRPADTCGPAPSRYSGGRTGSASMVRLTSTRIAWLLAAAVVTAGLGAAFALRGRQAVLNKADVANLVARELPVGSPQAKVVAFLDARHIEHSGYESDRHITGIIHKV